MAWLRASQALTKMPELLLKSRVTFDFDGVPQIAERLSIQKKANLIRVGIDTMLGSSRAHGLPPIIQVEPTNVCNLACPLCPTGQGTLERPKGFMSVETFQRILDDLGDILVAVHLYSWGEPFLNEDLPNMIEMCTNHNICTLTSTNGHFLQRLDEALKVVDAGLKTLIIAIDGSTQEIYQSYRKGGDLEKVRRCTANIEEAKALRGSRFPFTALRSVVTRDNQNDLTNLERLASDLGADMFTCKTLGCLPCSGVFKEYEPTDGNYLRFEYAGSSRIGRPLIQCPFPFRQPTIFWDGTVVGCEYDYNLTAGWGNIATQHFTEIWNSPQAIKLRHSIRECRDRPSFCSPCPYQDRAQDFVELYCKELKNQ